MQLESRPSGGYIDYYPEPRTSKDKFLEAHYDEILGSLNDSAVRTAVFNEIYKPYYNKINSLSRYNNQVIYDTSTQKYFRITVTALGTNEKHKTPSAYSDAQTTFMNYFATYARENDPQDIVIKDICYEETTFNITAYEYVDQGTYSTTISTERRDLEDEPWTMFAMPYGEFTFIYKPTPTATGYIWYTCEPQVELGIANSIAIKESGNGGRLKDLQILPYCPIGFEHDEGDVGSVKLDNLVEGKDYNFITHPVGSGTRPGGIIFWATSSKFTLNIPVTYTLPDNSIDFKIENETKFVRLCAPDYSGVFEFRPTENNGLQYINVDCHYQPFNPYIHANPNFGGLYGDDYNDTRGLICQGDFSLPRIADQWQEYQLTNKNYQAIFNREIENLGVVQSNERLAEKVKLVTGAISAGATGAGAGALAGGGVGAVIGAPIAAGASIAGGIADININEKLRFEALDLKRDMFGFSLQNIRAQAQNISKTSALSNNNKLFLVLEEYDATDDEKEALRNKITYNGMTVGTIGTIGDYIQPQPTYIKGQIIRINLSDDFDTINQIAAEFDKGVYL